MHGARPLLVDRDRGLARLAAEDLLQLLFVHARPTFDAALLGLVAQLVVGPAARAAVGPKPAPASRRDVVDRRRARLFSLAVAGALLVHRPGRDLLRLVLVRAALEQPFFDVFVLSFPFVAPRALWHPALPPLFLP